jgi:MscS family membrane protein
MMTLSQIIHVFKDYEWLIELASTLIIGLLFSGGMYYLNKYYIPKLVRRGNYWRSILFTCMYRPLLFYVWLWTFGEAFEIIAAKFGYGSSVEMVVHPTQQFLGLIILFWFVMRFISQWERGFIKSIDNGQNKTFQDITSVNALAQVLRIMAIIIIFLMLLNFFGISISTLLAFGGVGGLAFSFAAKDTVANFIGGIMIFWDKPFRVGDSIRSPDREIEGIVENIGWRLTRIRTPTKCPLYVPNGVFSTISVENTTRMQNRLLKFKFGIRYADAAKISTINADIEKMLRQHVEIEPLQTISVRLMEFSDSCLNILISAFTKTIDLNKFQTVQEDILLKVIDIVASHRAEFAYPAQTLYFSDGAETVLKGINKKTIDV